MQEALSVSSEKNTLFLEPEEDVGSRHLALCGSLLMSSLGQTPGTISDFLLGRSSPVPIVPLESWLNNAAAPLQGHNQGISGSGDRLSK